MKFCIPLIICVLFFSSFNLFAQSDKSPNFIGLNPSVTVEPFYDQGELDINILPIVWQKPINKRFDIRLTSLLNLGIRNDGNAISHYGAEIAVPMFFQPKEDKNERSQGFYMAAILSPSRNQLEAHNNLGIWAEPGYNFLFDDGWALSLGVQFGSTFFAFDEAPNEWGYHFGVKVVFGKWF